MKKPFIDHHGRGKPRTAEDLDDTTRLGLLELVATKVQGYKSSFGCSPDCPVCRNPVAVVGRSFNRPNLQSCPRDQSLHGQRFIVVRSADRSAV
jgi:hypothetical protein